MFRLFGLLLVGLVLAGCASPTKMIESGTIKLGMSKTNFESKMYWGTDSYNDPGMENYGGSGYMPNFYDYTIVYGGNKNKIFVFDPNSNLVAITKDIDDAEKLVVAALRSGSKVKTKIWHLRRSNRMRQHRLTRLMQRLKLMNYGDK